MKVTLIRCSGEACRQPRLSAKLLQAFFESSSSNLDLPLLLLLLLPTSRGSCCRLLWCSTGSRAGGPGDCWGREARRGWMAQRSGSFLWRRAAALGWCLANQCSVEETVNESWIFLSKGDVLSVYHHHQLVQLMLWFIEGFGSPWGFPAVHGAVCSYTEVTTAVPHLSPCGSTPCLALPFHIHSTACHVFLIFSSTRMKCLDYLGSFLLGHPHLL